MWFERMAEYGFTENQDYVAISQKRLTAQGNGTTQIDHIIKLDMAKEIAMIQRMDKDKQDYISFLGRDRRPYLKRVVSNCLFLSSSLKKDCRV